MREASKPAGLFGRYRVLLAPMAGVSDIAFRQLCREQGADLAYTEMVSAKGLSYANEKTRHLLDLAENESMVGVQLFGHEPEVMAEEASWVEGALGDHLALLDINMGCPARKIVKKGDGAALMREPALAAEIVRAVVSRTNVPVTVKFRRGWAMGSETAPEFAKRMEDAGAKAVTVHGRYAEQLYRGASDAECIARTKEALSIPVVGNGDIFSSDDALRMVSLTHCDAVMVARGSQGNPWLFAQIQSAFDGREAPAKPTVQERIEMARRHARLLDALDRRVVVRMRKHAMWYMHGLPGAASARGRLNACTTLAEFEAVLDGLLEASHAA